MPRSARRRGKAVPRLERRAVKRALAVVNSQLQQDYSNAWWGDEAKYGKPHLRDCVAAYRSLRKAMLRAMRMTARAL
jgi:hypothetical protein